MLIIKYLFSIHFQYFQLVSTVPPICHRFLRNFELFKETFYITNFIFQKTCNVNVLTLPQHRNFASWILQDRSYRAVYNIATSYSVICKIVVSYRAICKVAVFLSCNLLDSWFLLCNLQDSNTLSCNLQDTHFLLCNLQDSGLL